MDKRLEVLQDVSANRGEQIKAALETVHQTMPELNYELGFKVHMNITVNQWHRASVSLYDSDDAKKRKWIGDFRLEQFPDCNHIVISTGVYIDAPFRGKGLGKYLNKLRIRAMSLAGFERLYATVRNDNAGEEHILEVNGWKRLSVLEDVSLWERIL